MTAYAGKPMAVLPNRAPQLRAILRWLLPLLFSLAYAAVLTSLPLLEFLDRDNYLIYAQDSDEIMARFSALNPLAVVFNEPLWLLINIGLAKLFAGEVALRIIIFVAAFVVSWLLLRHNPRHIFWMMAFLLMPQVMKNHVIHLRQGLGLAVFLLGYFSGAKWRGRLLMLAAGFIHTSLLFIAVIFSTVYLIGLLRLSPRLRVILLLLGFSLLGVAVGTIAGMLGARQAGEYSNVQTSFSGLGFLFWSVALGLFLSAGRDFLQSNMASLAILAFYLTTYFTLPVSARIFESGLAFIFMSGLALPGWRRQIFLLLIFGYTLMQYAMNLGRPWLGWGVSR